MIMWIGIIVILASIGLIFLNVKPVWVQQLGFAVSIGVFALMLVTQVKYPEKLKRFINKRLLLVIMIPFLVVVGFISRKYEQVWDLSQDSIYSLRAETIEWLSKIKEPLNIKVFATRDDKIGVYLRWLTERTGEVTPFLKFELININKEVELAKKYGVSKVGETVLELQDGRWIKIDGFRENALTKGVIKILSKSEATVCFSYGEGEPDIEDTSPAGLSLANDMLKGLGYRTLATPLVPASGKELSDVCTVLVMNNPRVSVHSVELDSLMDFIKVKPAFLMFSQGTPVSFKETVAKYGIDLSGKEVVNYNNLKRRTSIVDLMVDQYTDNPISRYLTSRLYIPHAQAISTSDLEGVQWGSILKVYDKDGFQKEGGGGEQEFNLAVSGEDPNGDPRFVVIASGLPFVNSNFQFGDNHNLFVGSVRWLLKENRVELMEDRQYEERKLELDERMMAWIKNTVFYVLPGISFIICLAILLKHRRQ